MSSGPPELLGSIARSTFSAHPAQRTERMPDAFEERRVGRRKPWELTFAKTSQAHVKPRGAHSRKW